MASEKTSDADGDGDEGASQATSVASSGSALSKVSLASGSEDERLPMKRGEAKRRYKNRTCTKKPSVSLGRILPVQSLLVCVRAAMFLLGVPWSSLAPI